MLVVRQDVAQVFEVVKSRPLSHVRQLLILPEHVAQLVLHSSHVPAVVS